MIKVAVIGIDVAKLRAGVANFENRLQENIQAKVQRKLGKLHSSVLSAMALQPENKDLTLILKSGTSTLIDTKLLAKKSNYSVWKADASTGVIGVNWGIRSSVKGPSGSKFRSMASLVYWLNGSNDLARPSLRVVRVTKKMASLFKIVAGLTRKKKRSKRKRKRKVSPNARAAELIKRARGREIFPIREGSHLFVKPRPFLPKALELCSAELTKEINSAVKKTISEIFASARENKTA